MTDHPRYRKLARYYGPLVAQAGGTCGCHVHVGVPSRDLGVQVLARLRPWLASLLAITVNSPIAGGRDTTWASWRYPAWSRWPTAVPPAVWPDAAAYDTAVRRLIARGAAVDEQGIHFLARLSPRYPTVEIRVADTCLDVGTAVLLAGLTRALVTTALAEARQGTPVPAVPARRVSAALAAAARHGLAGTGVDPFTGQPADARSLRSRLLDHVRPALSDRGDAQTITMLLRQLDQRGDRGRPPAGPLCQRRIPAPDSSRRSPARRYPEMNQLAAASRKRDPSSHCQRGRQGRHPPSPPPAPTPEAARPPQRQRRRAVPHAQRRDLAQPADKRQTPRSGNLSHAPKGPVTCD